MITEREKSEQGQQEGRAMRSDEWHDLKQWGLLALSVLLLPVTIILLIWEGFCRINCLVSHRKFHKVEHYGMAFAQSTDIDCAKCGRHYTF